MKENEHETREMYDEILKESFSRREEAKREQNLTDHFVACDKQSNRMHSSYYMYINIHIIICIAYRCFAILNMFSCFVVIIKLLDIMLMAQQQLSYYTKISPN